MSERKTFLAPYEMRQAINPQATAQMAEQWYTRFVPAIDGLRNVLVILPLTITWLSLAIAALAYSQTLPKIVNVIPTPGFFQLWQEGFPQLNAVRLWRWTIPLVTTDTHYHFWTFTDMAILDVAILTVMLLLTGLSQMVTASAVWRSRKLEVWLEKQLHELSKSSAVWSLSVSEQQPRWAAEVQIAINSLNTALGNIKTAVTTFGDQMVEQGKTVQQAVAQTGTVPQAVNDLVKVYQQAIDAQALLQSALPSIQQNLESVNQSQQQTTVNWIKMSQDLGTAIEAFARVVDEMGGTGDLGGAIQNARDIWRNSGYAPRPRRWWRRIRWPFSSH